MAKRDSKRLAASERRTIRDALAIIEARIQKPDAVLKDPRAARDYVKLRIGGMEHEVFGALWLNTQHGVIDWDDLSHGTLNAASVYPREVVKKALSRNAAAVIFAHNHPSGVSEPSPADRSLTQRLKDALALVDIRVIDHFVIGLGAPVSFAERGWL